MLLQISFGLVLVLAQQFCHCNDHVYGTPNSGAKVIYDKEIFAIDVPQPKNYTLIFKYIGSESSPNITYAIFNVNTESNGPIEVSSEIGKQKTLQAMLNIVNGTNIRVNCKIFAPSVSVFTGVQQGIHSIINAPKTMTIVYGQNSTQTQNRIVILGQRQPEDIILDQQRANVTVSQFQFAKHEFEYHNKDAYITAAKFAFDYPTATAFINSSFVGENKLNAIVYDLNTPWFIANMTIFGYRGSKPTFYKPIVLAKKNTN